MSVYYGTVMGSDQVGRVAHHSAGSTAIRTDIIVVFLVTEE